jgi:hypothetical protein
LRLEGLAVYRYGVGGGVGAHAHLFDDLTVDGDAACGY